MKIFAIESSCDETACAVVEDGRRVLSSVIASQVEEHRLYGGVVPEIASRRHAEAITGVADKALSDAGVSLDGIDAVAVTYAPGLIGVNFAKGIALAKNKPLIPVHHLRSHIAANYIAHPSLEPPFLCLVVSGGHSHIIEVQSYTEFRVLGRTRDDAAGEAYDKAARALGYPYPGGVEIDRAAKRGDKTHYKLPRPKVVGSPYDFSFSGLKTAVVNLIHNAGQKGEAVVKEDVAAAFQDAVSEILVSRTMAAAAETRAKTLVLAGGVSANSGLRARMQAACETQEVALYMPPLSLCGDNAAMVGAQGYYEFRAGNTASMDLNAVASLSIER